MQGLWKGFLKRNRVASGFQKDLWLHVEGLCGWEWWPGQELGQRGLGRPRGGQVWKGRRRAGSWWDAEVAE